MAMAYEPMASRQHGVEMFQKSNVQSVFVGSSNPQPASDASDIDTEFEEDFSDFEEYSGRRSEDSFGKRSDTTASTFEELRTPASNDFKSFNFQLPVHDDQGPPKPVQGPVGPHLFRHSQDSTQEHDIYLEWSPTDSPKQAGPSFHLNVAVQQDIEAAPPSGVPLARWRPQQVAGWMKKAGFDESAIDKFRINDISGAILQHLKFDDLKELGFTSFGQRHHLWDEIRNLRGGLSMPTSPIDDCHSPSPPLFNRATQQLRSNECSNPATPDEEKSKTLGRRRARRALRPDDVISPAESASIVAIEQLLPKPHHCSKGENCSKWQKQQRKLAKIAKEFPLELEQIGEANASPSELTMRPTSEAVPSVVASSDLLGPGRLPALRIDEDVLRTVKTRDPQENVRQFLDFQHLNEPAEEPTTPPYEMFPPLSPPSNTQAPHSNLRQLPKLTIPTAPQQDDFDLDRTIIRQTRTPVTAMEIKRNSSYSQGVYRFASPASAMDVPVTAIPYSGIERDASQSVPPDMRFGTDPFSRSTSRAGYRHQAFSPISRPSTTTPLERSTSHASRRHPNFAMPPALSPIDNSDEKTPTATDVNHEGFMKKRKTRMLRHEWQENHFRLNGTRLAMHRDEKTLDALECIDVDEYAVACSSLASNKLNTAFKTLKLSNKKKEGDASAFSFQLVPAAEKKGVFSAARGKTHHFAVKTRDERIDWMRELMLAKALRQKADGAEVNVNGNLV